MKKLMTRLLNIKGPFFLVAIYVFVWCVRMAISEMSEGDMSMIRAAFNEIDVGKDGLISVDDLVAYLKRTGLSEDRAIQRANALFVVCIFLKSVVC